MSEILSTVSINRRAFLGRSGLGLIALTTLWNPALLRAAASTPSRWTGIVNPPHHPQRAKRVIFLYMSGGPSHLETFDSKPQLARLHGQPMPDSFTRGQQIAQLQGQELVCFAPQFPFSRRGRSGQEISDLLPHIGGLADEITIIRSMVTDAINHDPAHTLLNTGTTISGRPSMGSWVLYRSEEHTSELQSR